MDQKREDEILRLYGMLRLVEAGITSPNQVNRKLGNLAKELSEFGGIKLETGEMLELYCTLSKAASELQVKNMENLRENRRQKQSTAST